MKTVSSRERDDRQYGDLPMFYNVTNAAYINDMSDVVQWDTYPYDE